jgi:hypothetical protein
MPLTIRLKFIFLPFFVIVMCCRKVWQHNGFKYIILYINSTSRIILIDWFNWPNLLPSWEIWINHGTGRLASSISPHTCSVLDHFLTFPIMICENARYKYRHQHHVLDYVHQDIIVGQVQQVQVTQYVQQAAGAQSGRPTVHVQVYAQLDIIV